MFNTMQMLLCKIVQNLKTLLKRTRDLPLGLMFCLFCSPHVAPNEVISLACSGQLPHCWAALREAMDGQVVPATIFGFHYSTTFFYPLVFHNSSKEAKSLILMVFSISQVVQLQRKNRRGRYSELNLRNGPTDWLVRKIPNFTKISNWQVEFEEM